MLSLMCYVLGIVKYLEKGVKPLMAGAETTIGRGALLM
jgi:hypothetical protein